MRNEITQTYAPSPTAIDRVAGLVLDTVSERTATEYRRALNDFIAWHLETRQVGLTKAVVQAHIVALKARGVTDSSINQRLAALRKLAMEAADNGLIDEGTAQAIGRIKNIERQGRKLGNWLDSEQAAAMISAPNTSTLKGLRDRAVLAVMLGGGLRREEVASLTVEHLQQRAARWVILDLVGKHKRTRTIPIAGWIKVFIDAWLDAAGIDSGPLFRPVFKGGRLGCGPMSSQSVWNIVSQYAPLDPGQRPGEKPKKIKLAPHDLRRTFAKLADEKGAPLDQIQQVLGHKSVQTTETYVGRKLNLSKSPSDYIELNLGA